MSTIIRKILKPKKPVKKEETVTYTGTSEHITPLPIVQREPKFYYEKKLKRSSSIDEILDDYISSMQDEYCLYDEFNNKRKRMSSIYSRISIPDTIQEMIDDIIESYGMD